MEVAEIERELEELETRVERLRALYEQYFMGIEKLEPQIARKDVERRIWMLRREQIRNTGMRFKFQMVIQRFNTFQQYWGRVTREIENGTYRRDVMRAAARVGEKEALTLVGRKRAKQFAALIEVQAAKRARNAKPEVAPEEVAEPEQLGWGDITEVMDDDDAPTPPSRNDAPLPHVVDVSALSGSARRRGREESVELDVLAEVAAAFSSEPPEAEPPAAEEAKPKVIGGLRWGGARQREPARATSSVPADASEPTLVEREPKGRDRVAELAAAMKKRADDLAVAPSFGLDLDFDDDHTLPHARAPAPKSVPPPSAMLAPNAPRLVPFAAGARPAPSRRRRSSRGMQAVRPPLATPPAAPAPPLEKPVADAAPEPSAPSPAPVAPAKAIVRPTPPEEAPTPQRPIEAAPAAPVQAPMPKPAPPPPRPAMMPAAPKPAAMSAKAVRPEPAKPEPRAPAQSDENLSDQRIRQIYSKYVETKRAANESTAGMTYERLAESLRTQATRLRTSHPTKTVDYDVVVKDGKTMLKPILR